MQNDNKLLALGVVVAIVIAIVGLFTPFRQAVQQAYGTITNGTNFKHGLSVGNTTVLGIDPTNFSKILAGTCTLIVQATAQTASTSAPYDCAVTGVVAGDVVNPGGFSTTTATAAWGNTPGWIIVGAKASTTSGFITFMVANQTGTASSLSTTGLASSTNYTIFGTQ